MSEIAVFKLYFLKLFGKTPCSDVKFINYVQFIINYRFGFRGFVK